VGAGKLGIVIRADLQDHLAAWPTVRARTGIQPDASRAADAVRRPGEHLLLAVDIVYGRGDDQVVTHGMRLMSAYCILARVNRPVYGAAPRCRSLAGCLVTRWGPIEGSAARHPGRNGRGISACLLQPP
jgi:hypothetical protein